MKCVHVEWLDSQTEVGWDSYVRDNEPPKMTHSVGFLLDDNKNFVVIAHSYDPETDEWNGRIFIPIAAIKEMRTLCHVKI